MIKLRNSLTKKIEPVKPSSDNRVRVYTCGPTVYGPAHIGNLRTFVVADTLARTIRYSGYDLNWVMNITDVDDKTIAGSKKKFPKLDPVEALFKFTLSHEKKFWSDLNEINVKKSEFTANPKPTEHLPEIQELIQKLKTNKLAYESEGSFYFDIEAYIKKGHKYGRLLELDLSKLKRTERVVKDEYEKENVQDFALWKAPKAGEPAFEIAVDGKNYPGHPGWHIECSAMSIKYLGQPFEIHTGAVDLIFPHHEDEIAQSEGANIGLPFAKIFLHNEHLLVENKKMSKSLGNVYELPDIKNKGFDPLALRYFYLLGHYKTKLNFTWDGLQSAQNALNGIRDFIKRLKIHEAKEGDERRLVDDRMVERHRAEIQTAFENDLNTPAALRAVNNFISEINKGGIEALLHEEKEDILEFFRDVDWLFGLDLIKEDEKIPAKIIKLAKEREVARKKGEYARSDELRSQITEAGYLIEDTADGPRLLRK